MGRKKAKKTAPRKLNKSKVKLKRLAKKKKLLRRHNPMNR